VNPAKEPYKKAQLILDKTPITVDLKRTTEGNNVVLSLAALGTVVETEHYLDDPSQFSFLGLNEERYDPALPILKFPFKIGDAWTWKGDYVVASAVKIPCEATLNVTEEPLNRPGLPTKAFRVTVKMTMEEGAKRDLSFWFGRDAGVVMRQVGQSSSREPAEPDNR